ncbi:hypothetical protein GL213_10360 [Halogeometricum borinquense]|uniref:DUF7308 domain-containing protein n=1 Tax=Halogeometricum borinquense TaxID=60847 RepID=A0A6C0ULG2_9EURY|nr:hypothetical protein [Halogeometricum borinquense]QIB73758.1 hypothetical protein G3I44_05315 [Halogeometricum borinquense]QIQ76884.1 hypothetical protein GL213_10360 [Halogeometricum borinquense]
MRLSEPDRRAVSSTLAVVLLLGMTLLGTGIIVGVGSSALSTTQQSVDAERAEQSMTQFDAVTAMVGLGQTDRESLTLQSSADGGYTVSPDDGWLRIKHWNYSEEKDEVVYNASLGSVTYRTETSAVTYQGGGVWQRSDGGTSMVSPPEFHYRDATLTLPVVRVRNTDSASGRVRAIVSRRDEVARVYPHPKEPGPGWKTYDDGVATYRNPVRNGSVNVTVHSEFYRGWAEYFRTRTTGNVTVDHDARTATLELATVGMVGAFELPAKNEGIEIRGMASDHPIREFEVSLAKSNGGNNNMDFSFYTTKGSKAYETVVHVPKGIGNYCQNGKEADMTMVVYYRNGTGTQHVWANDSIPAGTGPVSIDCSTETIAVNYTSDMPLTYDGSGTTDETALTWDDPVDSSPSFNHSGEDGENTTFVPGDQTTSRHLTRHYLSFFAPEFDLNAWHGPGNSGKARLDVDESTGELRYDTTASSQYITFLHVTENNVTVELS